MALNDGISMKNTLDVINAFCECAGWKCILINLNAYCKEIWRTNLKSFMESVRNTAFKCLGIYEGHDQEECYNKI